MNLDNFLKDYEVICRKHGAIIASCGCCDSPWVAMDKDIEEHIDHLKYVGVINE